MVDIADLDGLAGGSKQRKPFPEFDASKLQEAISGMSTVDKAMKEALGGSRMEEIIGQLTGASRALKGSEALAEQIRAATAPLGVGIHDRLSELDKASEALRGALGPKLGALSIDESLAERLGSGPDLSRYINGPEVRERFLHDFPPLPELPPNPIFETNALLEKLSTDFEDMKGVTAATADVQEKQAALIGDLLKAQIDGATAQQKAATETLRVAKISMWISLVAVLLTFVGIGAQAILG